MDFPILDLMDESACYQRLVEVLHPGGLHCPRCAAADGRQIHRRQREPVLDYRCKHCGRVFNAFTGTALQGTQRRPSQILLFLRGVANGEPTAKLARELGASRVRLLELRHKIQARAAAEQDRSALSDAVVEADEMYQNAGEKRPSAPRSGRPAAAAWPQEGGTRQLDQ